MSIPLVANATRCEEIRFNSVIRIRMAAARGGASTSRSFLDRERVGQLTVEGGQVVHTCDVGGTLAERQLLCCLLHAGVEVADDRLGSSDDLPLEFDLKAEAHHGSRGAEDPC